MRVASSLDDLLHTVQQQTDALRGALAHSGPVPERAALYLDKLERVVVAKASTVAYLFERSLCRSAELHNRIDSLQRRERHLLRTNGA